MRGSSINNYDLRRATGSWAAVRHARIGSKPEPETEVAVAKAEPVCWRVQKDPLEEGERAILAGPFLFECKYFEPECRRRCLRQFVLALAHVGSQKSRVRMSLLSLGWSRSSRMALLLTTTAACGGRTGLDSGSEAVSDAAGQPTDVHDAFDAASIPPCPSMRFVPLGFDSRTTALRAIAARASVARRRRSSLAPQVARMASISCATTSLGVIRFRSAGSASTKEGPGERVVYPLVSTAAEWRCGPTTWIYPTDSIQTLPPSGTVRAVALFDADCTGDAGGGPVRRTPCGAPREIVSNAIQIP